MTGNTRTDAPAGGLQLRFRNFRDRVRDRVLVLLTALLAFGLFVVAPLHAAGMLHSQVLAFSLLGLLVVGLLAVSSSPFAAAAMLAAFALAILAAILRLGDESTFHVYLDTIAWLILGLALMWVIARAVFVRGRVTYHRVVGAILLYLTIGLTFVALYTLVALWVPASFSGLPMGDPRTFAGNLVYFSFVTLTSTGYGDVLPVHPLARSLANVEAIIGQLYPATLLARLVSLEIAHSGGEDK
jgi:hypothetical protein